MYVKKRSGVDQQVSFDKIKIRLQRLSKVSSSSKKDSFEEYYKKYENMPEETKRFFDEHFEQLTDINLDKLTQKVIDRLYDGMTTRELDEEAARLAAGLETQNINYGILAKRILISNLHKNTSNDFQRVIKELYCDGIIADYMYYIVCVSPYGERINNYLKYERDYRHDYFGFKTLEKMYLLRNKNRDILERIQHMWMRVAIALFRQDVIGTHTEENMLKEYADVIEHDKFVKDEERSSRTMEIRKRIIWTEIDNINFDKLHEALEAKYGSQCIESPLENIFKLYDLMSQGYCTHATPTLFNSGTRSESHISCYLKASSDSIEGMYQDNAEIAKLFKSAGGVGFHIHDIRGRDALIKSSNRPGEGIVPYIKMLNDTSRHVKQGGRRNGSLALYLETWHVDIMDFLELKKPQGDENARARDLFYALWIPDMFMEAVKYNDWWYLMSPDECPGLSDVHNDEFRELYMSYVKQGRYRRKIRALEIWDLINEMRIETGTPYLVSKDASNRTSNQQNLGTIKSSNLCAEIILYSNNEQTADCVLASVALTNMITKDLRFDYNQLGNVVSHLVKSLNRIIDCNNYVTEKTRRSNDLHRPIGIGVQGLADCFMKLRLPFDSPEARVINKKIFETMYYHALRSSVELSKLHGPYKSFEGSPASKGLLQFDLWKKDINTYGLMDYDWDALKEDIKTYGLRNSTLLALMPTASTSIILGNNECMEPITANLYKRKNLAGEFVRLNKYLVRDLEKVGLWNTEIKDMILAMNGSIQQIPVIPERLKKLYKTVWEMKQKVIVDLAIERGPYICQSQSMNLYFENPTKKLLNNSSFYAWERGLKTLCYYTRTRPATGAVKFTLDKKTVEKATELSKMKVVCTDDVCTMCSA